MREILSDVIRQTSGLFETVKVTGTTDETKFQAVHKDKTVFLQGSFKIPQPELSGIYGLTNLGLLNSLLNFSSYKSEGSKLKIKRENKTNAGEVVTEIQFKGSDAGSASYKTMSAALIGEQANISDFKWDVQVTPSKSRISEFIQLAGIYAGLDTSVNINTKDGDLMFYLGGTNESCHNASMVFASEITSEISTLLKFEVAKFISVIKLIGSHNATVNIASRGVLGVTISTEHGIYNYYIRAKRAGQQL